MLLPGGGLEPGNHVGWDPAAVLDLQPVGPRPVAYLRSALAARVGLAQPAGRAPGGSGDLAAGSGIAGQDGAQLPGVDLAQVDLVVRAVQPEADCSLSLAAVNIIDGSGLSPLNRVTTDALVKVLQFASKRPWFNSFYSALPEINGMKMKSGSIGGARSFAGYQTDKNGQGYIYAIIVNNYDGPSSDIIHKMWKVLDILK